MDDSRQLREDSRALRERSKELLRVLRRELDAARSRERTGRLREDGQVGTEPNPVESPDPEQ